MGGPVHVQGILVCGYAIAARLTPDFFRRLGAHLPVTCAHTRDRLREELQRGKQPICIAEHLIPLCDPIDTLRQFFGEDAEYVAGSGHLFFSQTVKAHELLPELLACSPETKFVITSHSRGFGVPREERRLYKERPEVLRVMGFVNAEGNSQYLLRTLSRIYLGRTWRPVRGE